MAIHALIYQCVNGQWEAGNHPINPKPSMRFRERERERERERVINESMGAPVSSIGTLTSAPTCFEPSIEDTGRYQFSNAYSLIDLPPPLGRSAASRCARLADRGKDGPASILMLRRARADTREDTLTSAPTCFELSGLRFRFCEALGQLGQDKPASG